MCRHDTNLQTQSVVVHLSFASNSDSLVALTAGGQLLVWDARSVAKWASAAAAQGATLPAQVTSASSDHAASPLRVTGATPFVAAAFFRSRSPAVSRLLITVEGGGGHTRVWDTSQNPWAEVWCVPDTGCHAADSSVMLCSAVDEAAAPSDAAAAAEGGPISAPGTFATTGSDGIVNVFDMESRRHTLQLRLQVTPTCVEFAPGGHALLVGDASGVVQALDSDSMQPTAAVQMAAEGTPVRLLLAARVTASLRAAAAAAAAAAGGGTAAAGDRRPSLETAGGVTDSQPAASTPDTEAPPSTIKYRPSVSPAGGGAAAAGGRRQQRSTPAPTARGGDPPPFRQSPPPSSSPSVAPGSEATRASAAARAPLAGQAPTRGEAVQPPPEAGHGQTSTHRTHESFDAALASHSSSSPPPAPPAQLLPGLQAQLLQGVQGAIQHALQEQLQGMQEKMQAAAARAAVTAVHEARTAQAAAPEPAAAAPAEVHHTTVQHEVFAAAADVRSSIKAALQDEMAELRETLVASVSAAVLAQVGDALGRQVGDAAGQAAAKAAADTNKQLSGALQQSFVSLLRAQHSAAAEARGAAAENAAALKALQAQVQALQGKLDMHTYLG